MNTQTRTTYNGIEVKQVLYSRASVEVKSVDEVTRTLVGIASTGSVDRDGEVIDPLGWDLKNYKTNPAVLLSHDYSQPPIGKAQWIKKSKDGLKFKAEFANTPVAQEVFSLYRDGFMKAFSVGFSPIEWKDGDGAKEPRRTYTKTELLEISAVSVPANADALVLAYNEGRIKTKALSAVAEGLIGNKAIDKEPDAEDALYDVNEDMSTHTCGVDIKSLYDTVAELYAANEQLEATVTRLFKRSVSIDAFISETVIPLLMKKEAAQVDLPKAICEAFEKVVARKTGKVV